MRTSTQLNLHQLSKLSTRLCQIEYLAVFSALDKNFTFVDRPYFKIFIHFFTVTTKIHQMSVGHDSALPYISYNGRCLKRLIVRKLRTFRKSLLYWYFNYDEFIIQITFIKCMMNWLYILDDNPSNQIRAIIKLRLVVNLNRISFLLPTKITQIDRFQKMEFQNLKLYICTRNLTILAVRGCLEIFSRTRSNVRT